jgi:hypothetical protein
MQTDIAFIQRSCWIAVEPETAYRESFYNSEGEMKEDASLVKRVPQQNFKTTHARPLSASAANSHTAASRHL